MDPSEYNMKKKKSFSLTKAFLADVFDNDIYSSKISKNVNYFIILIIIISTIEIIISTESSLSNYYILFEFIYYLTSSIFLIEVILRTYVAGEINKRHKGFKGKILFSFEFYNLIDIISILPFIFGFIGIELFPFLKALRVIRILKIMRYLPSVGLLQNAIRSKRNELIISLQTIFILSVLLSIGLYYAELGEKNTQFTSISQAMLWSVAKFIGDIGGYGDFIPITSLGKVLATLNGVLGIAIFALPAGVIGSGFVEEIEKRTAQKELMRNVKTLEMAFNNENLNNTIRIKEKYGFSDLRRRMIKIDDVKFNLKLSEEEFFEIAKSESSLRLRSHRVKDENGNMISENVFEYFENNTCYGTKINNESELTVLCCGSMGQPFMGHFSYALSKYLDCNYISVEKFSSNAFEFDKRKDFLINPLIFENSADDDLESFKGDLAEICPKNSIIIHIAAKNSLNEDIEISNGGPAGVDCLSEKSTFYNVEELNSFVEDLRKSLIPLKRTLAIQKNYGTNSENHVNWYIKNHLNASVFQIFISANLMKSPAEEYYQFIATLGENIKRFKNGK